MPIQSRELPGHSPELVNSMTELQREAICMLENRKISVRIYETADDYTEGNSAIINNTCPKKKS
jgi:hypothetical protein